MKYYEIKMERRKMFLRQSDLAEALGVSLKSVSNWENNKSNISPRYLRRFNELIEEYKWKKKK